MWLKIDNATIVNREAVRGFVVQPPPDTSEDENGWEVIIIFNDSSRGLLYSGSQKECREYFSILSKYLHTDLRVVPIADIELMVELSPKEER